ncbi:MAG TPA: hypothetical protein VJU78_01995, partial [Chitinophagaceae bacterium]|nr:hypothetical protein [Chitinophagaceae bacterium]
LSIVEGWTTCPAYAGSKKKNNKIVEVSAFFGNRQRTMPLALQPTKHTIHRVSTVLHLINPPAEKIFG